MALRDQAPIAASVDFPAWRKRRIDYMELAADPQACYELICGYGKDGID